MPFFHVIGILVVVKQDRWMQHDLWAETSLMRACDFVITG